MKNFWLHLYITGYLKPEEYKQQGRSKQEVWRAHAHSGIRVEVLAVTQVTRTALPLQSKYNH